MFAFINLGPQEMMIVLVLAVLLFGKRLPEVGRSLGKGLMEFKKGLNDIKSELNVATYSEPNTSHVTQRYNPDDHDEPTAPKFEPPKFEAPKFEPPAHEPVAVSPPAEQGHA